MRTMTLGRPPPAPGAAHFRDRDFGTSRFAAVVKCYIIFERRRKGPHRRFCLHRGIPTCHTAALRGSGARYLRWRGQRTVRLTRTTSPGSSFRSSLASSGRPVFAPLAFSQLAPLGGKKSRAPAHLDVYPRRRPIWLRKGHTSAQTRNGSMNQLVKWLTNCFYVEMIPKARAQ